MSQVDSIGSSRVEGESGGDSEVQRTMLELLNQLDGFEARGGWGGWGWRSSSASPGDCWFQGLDLPF